MKAWRLRGRGDDVPSVQSLSTRVALTTTAIVALVYIVAAASVTGIVTNNLTTQIDSRLQETLAHPVPPGEGNPGGFGALPGAHPFGAPLLVWTVRSDGTVLTNASAANVALPSQYEHVTGPETVTVSGVQLRIAGARNGNDWVVVGQTMENVTTTQGILIPAEIGIGAALLVVVFLGAAAIGRSVAQPIENSRQRQLEFTADASHELRTPLSVIEAQTTLALAKERPPEWYRMAFSRIDGESKRIRRLVDDMLWLARFDATRGQPQAEPVDVNVLAGATVDRFRAVAETRRIALGVQGRDGQIVTVPPEWLDRLLGVLLDNACKYSPEGGSVVVAVTGEGRRVRLSVDDSGPGIPPDERSRVFDRFHRATDKAGGAGLGLAIGDAIVKATNGRWSIGSSPSGGASVSISWPRSMSGTREQAAGDDTRVDAEA